MSYRRHFQNVSPFASHGFTLVEVMVALFVVSMALPALMWQLSAQAESMADLRNRVVAGWVAEEQQARQELMAAANMVPDASPTQGYTRMLGEHWPWVIQVESTDVPGMMRRAIQVSSPVPEAGGVSLDAVSEQAIVTLESWFVMQATP